MSDYRRSQGVVGPHKGEVVRQVFFPLTQEVLDMMDERGTMGLYSAPFLIGVDLERYLPLLPELEAEVVFMLCIRKKTQKDVAKLLDTSQPTVSYRFRRAIDKLSYLMMVSSVDLDSVVWSIPGINEKERLILKALFFSANQELVGNQHGVRQSSVKWIFTKSKRYVEQLELKEPGKWARHYGLLMLLERNLRKRIFS
jgi:hypothetical protein